MDDFFAKQLACPYERSPLHEEGSWLACRAGHRFPVVDGVPVLLRDDAPGTIDVASVSLEVARRVANGDRSGEPLFVSTVALTDEERDGILALAQRGGSSSIDPVASYLVAATNGILYKNLVGQLDSYPIPRLRLPAASGQALLDVGCSWGRWSIAAARKGYAAVGLDPSLGAVLAARRVAQQLGVSPRFVVGDARFLPFAQGTFDKVFSYSVVQHLSFDDAEQSIGEMGRVLRAGGDALVQMPNRLGVRCLYHQARRRFRPARGFEVRYWSLQDLRSVFDRHIGPAELSVDGFFGLGMQSSDAPLMDPKRRAVLQLSDGLRAASRIAPQLTTLADSVYVRAQRA